MSPRHKFSSSHVTRSGWLSVEYLREAAGVATLVAVLLLISTILLNPSTPASEKLAESIAKAPVYKVGFNPTNSQVWVNQLFTGLTEYDPQTGDMTAQWPTMYRTMTDMTRGGVRTGPVTTVLWDCQGGLSILQGEKLVFRQLGHEVKYPISDIDISADGRTIAVIKPRKSLTILRWNGDKFDERDFETKHECELVRVSPDGRKLALASQGIGVELRDISTGQTCWKISAHESRISEMAWSPNGEQLVTSGEDRLLKVWRESDGAPIWKQQADSLGCISLAFSPNGEFLASAGFDKSIRIWLAETGELVKETPGNGGPIRSLAFDPQGKWLVSGDLSGHVKLWSTHDWRFMRLL